MAEHTPQLPPEEKKSNPEQNWKPDHIIKQEEDRKKARIRAVKLCLAVAFLLGLFFAGVWYILFSVNQFTLAVTIKGDPEVVLEYGDTYYDPGAKVTLTGTLFWKNGVQPRGVEVQTDSDLRQAVVGKHTIHYNARFLWWEASTHRDVRVVDTTPPRITLMDQSNQTVQPGEKYVEEGFYAIDNYDGDITHLVRRTEELGVIMYVVKDSSGNLGYAERKIPYYDPVPPTLYLEGDDRITIVAGSAFEEPGYSAVDDVDGDITDRVETESTLNRYREGSYKITYSVSDTYGNLSRAIRIIRVLPHSRPEIVTPKEKVIYLTFTDGPGPDTDQLLDVLQQYDIKATFFVSDGEYNDVMQRIVEEGHSIGIHTKSDDYDSVYADEDSFFDNLFSMQELIYDKTGVMTTLMRFPGGGSGKIGNYNEEIMLTLPESVQDCGFQYFDYSADSEDTGEVENSMMVSNRIIEQVQKKKTSMVLLHDTNSFTVNAVEDVVVWALENEYTFLPVTSTSPNFHHEIKK